MSKINGARNRSVFDDLKRFRREAELEDDITRVVIKIEN
jgi:hypothetical protein